GNLELDFFLTIPALMRQVIMGTHRHVYAFAGDVDLEPLAILKRICKASELLDKLRKGIVLFDIAIFLHDLTPMTLQRIASALGYRLRCSQRPAVLPLPWRRACSPFCWLWRDRAHCARGYSLAVWAFNSFDVMGRRVLCRSG